ncbi:DUF2690 domain-containing protein [Nonomuraea typhae]|uniref:DUF2690 domain-containing protein n=1 Tax=Nonomuraea typhae TaxID=2603600 RepID=UPI0012F88CB1|nr:DUF2690 domain-containing protein [Nonomuraea typhae]
MSIRAVVAGVAATGALLATMSPAAHAATNYDRKDPYKTGCASSAIVSKQSTLVQAGKKGTYGTIKLMWSRACKTNWTEIWVSPLDSGIIRVILEKPNRNGTRMVQFTYGKGRSHHWGDMIEGAKICAWGYATARHTKSFANGKTATACG